MVEGSNAALEISLTTPIVYLGVGEEIDPNSYVEQVNDADGSPVEDPQLTVESQVNTQAAGCYEIHYQAADAVGNTGETWLTVIVEGGE